MNTAHYPGPFAEFVASATEKVVGRLTDEQRHRLLVVIRQRLESPFVPGQGFGPDQLNEMKARIDALEREYHRLTEMVCQLGNQSQLPPREVENTAG